MSDLVCPRCKTSKYRNPSLKLLVNVCGHALCDSCVELLFVKGAGACPECKISLRRGGFRVQLFEDPIVEKEVDIRKRVLKDYCKREHDFRTSRDYNDYLEEVETIIFNLVNNINILETNKAIEQYKRDNKDQISKSKNRPTAEMLELENILEEEKRLSEHRRYQIVAIEKEEKRQKLKNHEALIDDLMFSDTNAHAIVTSYKQAAANQETSPMEIDDDEFPYQPVVPTGPTFSSKFGIGSSTFLPLPKTEEFPLFSHSPYNMYLGGLEIPKREVILNPDSGYLVHVKSATVSERTGGFHSILPCQRALQEAFVDLAVYPKNIGIQYHQDSINIDTN